MDCSTGVWFMINSVQDIWQKVLDILSQQLTQTAMDTWFTDCRPVELDDCRLILCTGNEFKQNILQTRFGDRIRAALSELFAADFDVLVVTEDELSELPTHKQDSGLPPEMEPEPRQERMHLYTPGKVTHPIPHGALLPGRHGGRLQL